LRVKQLCETISILLSACISIRHEYFEDPGKDYERLCFHMSMVTICAATFSKPLLNFM
jgi:hypothetical protein